MSIGKANVKLKPSKVDLAQTTVKFLGMTKLRSLTASKECVVS